MEQDNPTSEAPAAGVTISTLRGGANAARVREHNERLVLSLIRRHETLSRAEVARLSGLSAQTVTVIMRALEEEGLLLRGAPVKGKVGQPSIPMRLNPDGAFSIGLKVGRRSADLVLVDFLGHELQRRRIAYKNPRTTDIVRFAAEVSAAMLETLPAKSRSRCAGIGIATPFELWNWGAQVGASPEDMAAWRGFDLAGEIEAATGLPTHLQNDATAACGAELALGRGREFENYCYFFIGFFIGGGIVLNNAIFEGPTGNAGAMGAMPLPGRGPGYTALLDETSLFTLENRLRAAGSDPSVLWEHPDSWGDLGPLVTEWEDLVAENLAMAAASISAVIDFPTIVVDGGFPGEVRDRIAAKANARFQALGLRGLSPLEIAPGTIGPNAPSMGGAILPILSRFFITQAGI
ncbi:ROK family transcriptional regulator [Pseudoruegeria sp. SHC-113]|uniref:ROK family transcriptional regulator n=1 Tax=Pseudoruegeria sp. SHC-113 TaxID=2855439 RepID=UPI0021BAE6D9|nr:ROK family transcriptional regulator [Pseudoruegeria sp. SHC-113]